MNTAQSIQNIVKSMTPAIVISSIMFIVFGVKIFAEEIKNPTSTENFIYATVSAITLIVISIIILVMILK